MNTNGLAKHYAKLGPWERIPLWFAARKRGDEDERQRLARSAPRKVFAVADSFGLLQALRTTASLYMMVQLDLTCSFWFALGAVVDEVEDDGPRSQALRMIAYDFVGNSDLWQRFCADAGIDPDFIVQDLPGFATVKHTEEAARQETISVEESDACLRRGQESRSAIGAYRTRPVEQQAQELREVVERLAKHQP